ncbi:MAG: molybdopterin-guanine dinucleotide biosynthesis protein B [Lachnospiraceae bacterium]|nr:molybdopterin-guanine dinucleotide biosynthesis protein B [Lachnospiraceae bacterium]
MAGICEEYMKRKYSAVILAGGKSTRMGQDKALLKLNNERFIDRLAREFSDCGEVLLSAAHAGDYADAGLRVVADEHQGIGPIEGIRQALLHAREEYVFVCAADMPFVRREMADYLAEFISSDHDVYVVRDEKRLHPLCAIYHKSVLPVIEALIGKGDYRLVDILNAVRTKVVELKYSCFDSKTVKNINTREEYRTIGRPVVFCVSGIKNSGKTYLIEKLINEFIRDGRSVGVIKHDGHDFDCDIEGTDSYRLYQAGAAAAAVFSETQTFLHERRKVPLPELIARMGEPDAVIIEGFKDSAYPKVEVVRKAVSDRPVCSEDHLICIATDQEFPDGLRCPVFDIDDVHGVFCCIKKTLFDA